MVKSDRLKKLLLISFALSGMTALIYEVVWIRPLQLVFGSTIYAVSTMLTTFMIGFALGAYALRNFADRTKNPALVFAGLELGIGLYGMIILSLFAVLPSIYLLLSDVPGFQFFQFILCFVILILPATLFGGTWPVINKAYSNLNKLGKDTGMLYSFNSLGAVFGSIAAGFILIPIFGIKTTLIFTASLNILVAFLIVLFLRSRGKNEN